MSAIDAMDPIDREVGRYLLEHKVVDRQKVQEAVAYSKEHEVGFRRALLALDLVDLEFLQRFLPQDAGVVSDEDLDGFVIEDGASGGEPAAGGDGAGAEETTAGAGPAASAPALPGGVPQAFSASQPSMIVPKGKGGPPRRLGEYLVDDEVIDEAQLRNALDYSKENGVFLGTALVSMRMIDEEVLSRYIIRQRQDLQRGKRGKHVKLGEILVQRRLITEEQLQETIEASMSEGKRIGEVLLEKGFITEGDLALALSEQLMIPVVNMKKNPPDPGVAVQVSKKLVTKHRALPYRREGGLMTVAMVDPLNIMALDDFKSITQCEIMPVITTATEFDEAVKNFLGGEEEELLEWFQSGMDPDEEGGAPDLDEIDQAPIVALVNKIVGNACKRGASDIHVDPREEKMVVRFRLDGMLRDFLVAPAEMATPVAARVKVMSNLNVAETRLPQDGKFRLRIGGNVVDFRVSVLPLITGEKLVMRILDQSKARVKIRELGLPPRAYQWFTEDGIFRPNGIVLVTGPTGSGKTSTLYAGLMAISNPKTNIHTVEDPVEFTLPGVTQVQVHPEWGLDFASVLKSFLRQDPDVILLGEIRDTETARIALKAAMTGHLVLSTLHTNDAISTIDRFLSMGIDRFLVGSAIKVVLAQRLMKRLCESCCEVDPEGKKALVEELGFGKDMLEQAELDSFDDIVVRKAVGCEECEKMGFKGRIGVFEVIRFDDEIAEMIVAGASNKAIYEYARSIGMITLREAAMIRVAQGTTPIQEVYRLTVPEPSAEERGPADSFLGDDGAGEGSAGPATQELQEISRAISGLEALVSGGSDGGGAGPVGSGKAAVRILELFRETWGEGGDLSRPQAKLGMERMRHYLEAYEDFAGPRRKALRSVNVGELVEERVVSAFGALTRRAMVLLEKKVDARALSLEPNLSGLPPIETDPELLGRILEHLVLNSVQAIPRGGRIRLVGRRGERGVEIVVVDTGPGLEESAFKAARRPFASGHPYGLGLGLPVVERFVEILGGSFELRSVSGKGTVATVRLP